jgi:hypothetical protein
MISVVCFFVMFTSFEKELEVWDYKGNGTITYVGGAARKITEKWNDYNWSLNRRLEPFPKS